MNSPRIGIIKIAVIIVSVFLYQNLNSFYWISGEDKDILSEAALQEFFDEFVAAQMDSLNIAGAVVSVVKDGEVRFMKGYGYADVEEVRPFDPDVSVLSAASVAKLVTATAVMQLYERGMVDLHADINNYLDDITIPDTYPDPVTLTHLLQHTGGFDERVLSLGVESEDDIIPLHEYIPKNTPPRIRKPGDIISYSNYGYTLAGYIVESVSGVTFEDYVEENIFGPLNMNRSTFREPTPGHLKQDIVRAYVYRKGVHEELPVFYLNERPAGSMKTTAEDMSRFMIAHLNGGRYGDVRILQEETTQLMQEYRFTAHPKVEGWTYGFIEFVKGSMRTIGHGGDLDGAHSILLLIPPINTGIFFSVNTVLPMNFDLDPRGVLYDKFIETFYPEYSLMFDIDVDKDQALHSGHVTGKYRWTRYPNTTIEKLLAPIELLQFQVIDNRDGTIRLSTLAGVIEPTDWVEVEPLLFRRTDRETYMAFRENDRGRITHMFFNPIIPLALEKVSWYETDIVLIGSMLYSVMVFLVVILLWLGGGLIRRLKKKEPKEISQRQRRMRYIVRFVSVCALLVVLSLGKIIVDVTGTVDSSFLFLTPLLTALSVVVLLLSIVLALYVVRYWYREEGLLIQKIGYTLFVVAGLIFAWQMIYWNVV